MRIIYDALENNNQTKFWTSIKIFVQSVPKETRVGTKQMGTRMVKLAMELYDAPWIQWYHEQMNLKKQSYILRYALLF